MAEYYAVLSKAVAGLDVSTPESRRAVYDKARNALIGQLKAIDPPLPTAEISRQRLELEEAIRRVERETSSVPAGAPVRVARPAPAEPVVATAAPATPPPPPSQSAPSQAAPASLRRSPQDVFRRAIQDAERGTVAPPIERAPVAAKAEAPSWANERIERAERTERAPPPPPSYLHTDTDGEPETSRDELRLAPDYEHEWDTPIPVAPPVDADMEGDGDVEEAPPRGRRGRRAPRGGDYEMVQRPPRPSRLPMIIMLVLLVAVLGGIAALGWSQRALLADIASGFGAGATSESAPPALQDTVAATQASVGGKDTDRLLGGGEVQGTQDVRVVAPAGSEDPIGQQVAASSGAATRIDTPPVDQGPPVMQRAILYEEPLDAAAAAAGVVAINASVAWTYVPNGINGPEIVGNVDVPERALKMKVAIRRNTDGTLPASHIVEIVVDAPADFPGGGVRDVPRVVFKPSEDARGQPLIGASARVADGFFWIALSGIEADVNLNLNLLRERVWIDIPLVYENGQRAILTLEKGAPGAQVFERALTAWTG